MDTALVISWKVPFPGREKQALGLAAEADEYWGKLAAEGKCTQPEWFFMPDGWGMWMIKGERRILEELLQSEPSRRLRAKGALLLDAYTWALAETGAGAQRFMTDYGTIGSELGIL
jgi:hypothetical protein